MKGFDGSVVCGEELAVSGGEELAMSGGDTCHGLGVNDEFAFLSSNRLEIDFDMLDSLSVGTDAISKSRNPMPHEVSKQDDFNRKATSQRNTGEASNSSPIDAAGSTTSFTNNTSRPVNGIDTVTSQYGQKFIINRSNPDTLKWQPSTSKIFY